MSASLVGSEMCIRDRQLPLPSEAVAIWARIGDCQMFSHAARMPAAALPVSYTHLTLPTICSV
eukprot:275461-Alexandrium_andersonii.AAC.1